MNARQARQIPISEILAYAGYQPAKITPREIWFLSPWREEQTASLKVDRQKNLYFDHGEGQGGNALDLAMRLCRGTVSEALQWLKPLENGNPIQPSLLDRSVEKKETGARAKSNPSASLTITKTQELQNPALIAYLQKRGIPMPYAQPYVQEAYFTNKGRNYFALAFSNDKGGWELRNPYFQGSIAPKAVTCFKGSLGDQAGTLNVFEGFMDFLSALTFLKQTKPKYDTLVLNSLAMAGDLAQYTAQYSKLQLFLDNDEAGKRLASVYPQAANLAETVYPAFKDVNEWLMKSPINGRGEAFVV